MVELDAVIIVFVLMIIYLIIGVVQIFCGILKFRDSVHGWCCVIGTVLLGLGMFTYRVLIGQKTLIAKLLHMFIMLIGVGFIFISTISINHNRIVEEKYESIHRYPGYVLYVAIILQIVIALVFFICLYNSNVRYYVAPFHDMMGIWIYIVLVGCCIAATHQWQELKKNETDFLVLLMVFTSMINVTIVLVVVLSPYFEWDIVI